MTSNRAAFQRLADEEFLGVGPSGVSGDGSRSKAAKANRDEQDTKLALLTKQLVTARADQDRTFTRIDQLTGKGRLEFIERDLGSLEAAGVAVEQQMRDAVDASRGRGRSALEASLATRLMLASRLAARGGNADFTRGLVAVHDDDSARTVARERSVAGDGTSTRL